MTPTKEEIARIAKGLTEAQRRAIRYDRFPPVSAHRREHPTYSALTRKGLLEFQHIIAGQGDFALAKLGLALRHHLLTETTHGQD